MRTNVFPCRAAWLILAGIACLVSGAVHAGSTPVGTAFSYQGQLKQSGEPLDNTADLQFSLWDGSDGSATQIGTMQQIDAVDVVEGAFTVDLDFGTGVFGGDARWLQIAVRSPAGSGTFTTLAPRQRLRPAPVAHHALSVNGSTITNLNASNIATGTISSSVLSGTYGNALTLNNAANVFTGNGAGLANLNASLLASGLLPSARLGGTYSNQVSFSNPANAFVGNGNALTFLNAGALVGVIPGSALGGTYHNAVTFNNGLFFGTFSGDGLTITSLNANALVGGTVPNSRLSGPYTNVLQFTNAANNIAGIGTGLTGLNATNIASGTLANLRTTGTSANTANTLVLRDASGNFSAGTITANGSALTNLNASSITTGNLNSARMPTGGTWPLSSTQTVTGPPGFVAAFQVMSEDYNAIEGTTNENIGVAVYGTNIAPGGRGVVGVATGVGSWAVFADGNSGASGTKSFQIDHPRDPENTYLLHYSAEGPEPFNLYRGNVTLNGAGEAWVQLPDYFEDINRDFHYQLTSIGAPSPNLHVALEIVNNQFMVAGGQPGAKVSWTVTAVRNDVYVRHYPPTDVREKPDVLKGTYQHPEIFGQPVEKGETYRRSHLAELEN